MDIKRLAQVLEKDPKLSKCVLKFLFICSNRVFL